MTVNDGYRESPCCIGVRVLFASERLMAPLGQVLATLRRGLLEERKSSVKYIHSTSPKSWRCLIHSNSGDLA
jgi:hypothetical protein